MEEYIYNVRLTNNTFSNLIVEDEYYTDSSDKICVTPVCQLDTGLQDLQLITAVAEKIFNSLLKGQATNLPVIMENRKNIASAAFELALTFENEYKKRMATKK